MIDALKTVLYGAIGIRRRADHERAQVKLVIAAVLFVVLFVLTLRYIVSLVVS